MKIIVVFLLIISFLNSSYSKILNQSNTGNSEKKIESKSEFFEGKWKLDSVRITNYFDFVSKVRKGFGEMFDNELKNDTTGKAKKNLDKILKESRLSYIDYLDSITLEMFGNNFVKELENSLDNNSFINFLADKKYTLNTKEIETGTWETMANKQVLLKTSNSGVIFKYEFLDSKTINFTMVQNIEDYVSKDDYHRMPEYLQNALMIITYYATKSN